MKIIFLVLAFLLGSTTVHCVLDSSLFTGCGVTKTCLTAIPGSCSTPCTESTCKLLYTIQNIPNNDQLLIGLYSDGNYGYMALGFSKDQSMLNSDVIGCHKSDATTAHVEDTFNPSLARTNLHDGDNSALSNFSSNINGSDFSCTFYRDYLPQDPTKGFTLNTSYYLFLAHGSSFSEGLNFPRHPSTPCMSSSKVDVLSLSNVTSSGVDYSLVRAHGLLMLLAWSVFISIGVFMAGYSKSLFPNGEWFHFHKYLNLFAVLTALVGVALIFIHLREWKIGTGTLWAHQLLGLAAILLMLLNPIIAAFRCRPNAKFRWIFRSIHSGVGYSAVVVASTAIGLGLSLYYNLIGKNIWTSYGFWIYMVRLVTELFFHIPLIIYLCYKCHNRNKEEKKGEKDTLPKINPIKLFLLNIFAPPTCPTGEDRKRPEREWPVILSVLIAFIVYNLCFYVAIVIAVAVAENT